MTAKVTPPPPGPPAAPRYRRPQQPPAASARDDIRAWEALLTSTPDRVAKSAEQWRTGLAGFVTLIATVLVLQGDEASADIAWPWRLLVAGLFTLGLGLAIRGLWAALNAAAPPMTVQRLDRIVGEFGTVRAQQIVAAREALGHLDRARRLVGWSLVVIIAATLAWWFVPSSDDPAPSQILVISLVPDAEPTQVCGKLVDSHDGVLRVEPADGGTPTTVPLSAARTVRLVGSCPS